MPVCGLVAKSSNEYQTAQLVGRPPRRHRAGRFPAPTPFHLVDSSCPYAKFIAYLIFDSGDDISPLRLLTHPFSFRRVFAQKVSVLYTKDTPRRKIRSPRLISPCRYYPIPSR